ncbi:recombinase family protein [Acuticoccus sp. MNP-M23]|uniref:recombinase family protein n=1 Tax=Acuticoccus sp. MNP-M23 TaxID=3072793 RepID=UPI002815864E|nr:recombinase family protein [Acuticoccus sp. MNP-M23]WMS40824.1 recombinase family protein [Acuticoccus sp. MNP-M23]
MSKTVLYARVSTTEQTLSHQRTQAEAAGFTFDDVLSDHGVSGVSVPLNERPEGRRLFDVLRAGDVLVVRWIDRLGRNYADVTETVRELLARGITIKTVINAMTFDGSAKDPMSKAVRDAQLSFMAAMAEAQVETTREAQAAGIAAARERGTYRGRKPSFDRQQLQSVVGMLAEGLAPAEIARRARVSRQTVYRIKEDPAGAGRALRAWEAA